MATYKLTVPTDVWIDDVCKAEISLEGESDSQAMEQVTVLLSMAGTSEDSSEEGEEDPYAQFDTELTLDGWIDDKITFSFRDFARSAFRYGMDFITLRILTGEETEEAEAEGEEETEKTVYLHGGIRPYETIYPLAEYRVRDNDDTQPVFFVGKDLILHGKGVGFNTCKPPGNAEEETSKMSSLARDSKESESEDDSALWYACGELSVGTYMLTAPGGVKRPVKVRPVGEVCEKIKVRWTGMYGFQKAWTFEATAEQFTAENNVDLYDMDTIGYLHRSGYRAQVTAVSRGLTLEQRRYLADIGVSNDVKVDWLQEDVPARVGSAPSVSLTGTLSDVSVTFYLLHVAF